MADVLATTERVWLDEHSWVDVTRGWLPAADEVFAAVREQAAWFQGRVFRYERWIDEPRLGSFQKGASRHPALAEAEDWIAHRYRVRFDGVALALYRHERDSVAFHRDREMKWLEDTVIGVLTLGARRPWLMKPIGSRRDERREHGRRGDDAADEQGEEERAAPGKRSRFQAPEHRCTTPDPR